MTVVGAAKSRIELRRTMTEMRKSRSLTGIHVDLSAHLDRGRSTGRDPEKQLRRVVGMKMFQAAERHYP